MVQDLKCEKATQEGVSFGPYSVTCFSKGNAMKPLTSLFACLRANRASLSPAPPAHAQCEPLEQRRLLTMLWVYHWDPMNGGIGFQGASGFWDTEPGLSMNNESRALTLENLPEHYGIFGVASVYSNLSLDPHTLRCRLPVLGDCMIRKPSTAYLWRTTSQRW
jgi:hypothetical protein